MKTKLSFILRQTIAVDLLLSNEMQFQQTLNCNYNNGFFLNTDSTMYPISKKHQQLYQPPID